jgi:hypothetical protein
MSSFIILHLAVCSLILYLNMVVLGIKSVMFQEGREIEMGVCMSDLTLESRAGSAGASC